MSEENEIEIYGWICPVCGSCINPDVVACPNHEFSAAPFCGFDRAVPYSPLFRGSSQCSNG